MAPKKTAIQQSKVKTSSGKSGEFQGRRYIETQGDRQYYCWKIRHKGDEHVIKRASFKDREDAIAEFVKKLREQGHLIPKGKEITLAQHINQWLEDKVKPNKRKRTYRSYKQMARDHITPVIGSLKLSKVDSAAVQKVIATIQGQGLSNRTAQYAATILFASLGRRRSVMVREDVEMPKVNNARDRVMSLEEINEVLEELFTAEMPVAPNAKTIVPAYRDRYLLGFLMNTGLRICEGTGAMVVRLNLRESDLYVDRQLQWDKDEKTGKRMWTLEEVKSDAGRRHVPLTDMAVQLVRAQLAMVAADKERAKNGYEDNGLLFPTESGKPQHERNVRRSLDRAIKAINDRRQERRDKGEMGVQDMEPVSLHDLRRTYLTHLADVEERLHILAAIAGHKNPSTTMKHYVWAQERKKKEAAAKVSFGSTIQLPMRKEA